jgi:hypothetical protein
MGSSVYSHQTAVMFPRPPRRTALSTGGTALTTALACCLGSTGNGGQSGTGTGRSDERTDGFEVRGSQPAAPQDFGTTDEISEPEPAVVHLGVGSMDSQSDETYFEPTVEVQAEQS